MADKNFEQYQPKVCDTAPEPPPLKKLCSPCTPNKSFTPPDWRKQIDEPFLNQAECEYQIGVTINRDGDSFTASEFRNAIGEGKKYLTREQFLFSFVQPAIVLISVLLTDRAKTQLHWRHGRRQSVSSLERPTDGLSLAILASRYHTPAWV